MNTVSIIFGFLCLIAIILFISTRLTLAKTKAVLNEKSAKEDDLLKEVTEKNMQLADLREKERGLALAMEKLNAEHGITFRHKEELETKNDELGATLAEVQERCAVLSERNENLGKLIEDYKQRLTEIDERQQLRFKELASTILEEKSKALKSSSEEAMRPLREDLTQFKEKVENVYNNEARERHSLGKQIEMLMEQSRRLGEGADSLTRALKGDSKVQGDWGEMILESILERSGLVEGEEYEVQQTLRSSNGQTLLNEESRSRMRPDVIVRYPGNRAVIIDSKVSLTAYSRYMEAETEEEREAFATEHVRSVQRHINELAGKNYQDYCHETLDFVMLFIPIEAAYYLAHRQHNDIWSEAYEKRVLLISPSNLITALKLTRDLWAREKQQRNVQQIVAEAGALYDKFCTYIETFDKAEDSLQKAAAQMETARKQLTDGRGNLITRFNKLRKMGLNTKKKLPDTTEGEDEEEDPAAALTTGEQ